MKKLQPEEIAFSEADGAVSINAEVVAKRLNDLQEIVERLQQTVSRRCDCPMCRVAGARQ